MSRIEGQPNAAWLRCRNRLCAKALLPKPHKISLTSALGPQRGNFKSHPTVGKFRSQSQLMSIAPCIPKSSQIRSPASPFRDTAVMPCPHPQDLRRQREKPPDNLPATAFGDRPQHRQPHFWMRFLKPVSPKNPVSAARVLDRDFLTVRQNYLPPIQNSGFNKVALNFVQLNLH